MLVVIMVFGGAPLSGLSGLTDWFKGLSVTASAVHTWVLGDIGTFGSYPQTQVTDETLLSALTSKTLKWVSYGYYIGDGIPNSGDSRKGSMRQSNYMKYSDVTYGGSKFRAVKFTSYRPPCTTSSHPISFSSQEKNGYSTNTTYWFKYEPLKWRVLDPSTGLVMCETIIDSQAYSNTIYENSSIWKYYNDSLKTIYANDYATSSVRTWLNDDFYNTAFTSAEQSAITTTTLDNSAVPGYSQYNSAPTNDKLFLLSYSDSINKAYGFSSGTSSSSTRYAQGSDYAKCQGLEVSYSREHCYGNSYWWLRSPGSVSCYASYVCGDGVVEFLYLVEHLSVGIRPAFKISNLSQLNTTSSDDVQVSPSNSTTEPESIQKTTIPSVYAKGTTAQSDEALTTGEMTKPMIENETEKSLVVVAMLIIVSVAVLTASGIGFILYRRKTQ